MESSPLPAAPPPSAAPASAAPAAAPPAPAALMAMAYPAAAAAPSVLDQNIFAAASPASSSQIALQEQLAALEIWAKANQRDSRWDSFKFWSLKIPAIVVSAGSGVSAYFGVKGLAVIAGAVASMCVLIDALNPGGALRNAHVRAFNELRILQQRMNTEWQVGLLRHEDPGQLAADIIEGATKEKDRISAAITLAETSLASAAIPKR